MRYRLFALLFASLIVAVGCQTSSSDASGPTEASKTSEVDDDLEVATLAGGCFWCMEKPFDTLEGVESTIVGYTGGEKEEPTYNEVASGETDHVEAVEIRYDPEQITYDEILDVFWRSHDPTDDGGQFADRGDQYRPFVFYHDEEQRQTAEASRQDLEENGPFEKSIVTEIVPASTFWVAEEYHQDYYKKNPTDYQQYYQASGRGDFLDEVWGEDR